MLILDRLSDLAARQGETLGRSSWHLIDQERIDRFAAATGDDQWIHTDPARTWRELGRTTVAHGYLTLAMIPVIMYEIVMVKSARRVINCGANRIRFVAPVAAGSRIRGEVRLVKAVSTADLLSAVFEITVEIEGGAKPALVAEIITLFHE
jgi:acyl dehydratase